MARVFDFAGVSEDTPLDAAHRATANAEVLTSGGHSDSPGPRVRVADSSLAAREAGWDSFLQKRLNKSRVVVGFNIESEQTLSPTKTAETKSDPRFDDEYLHSRIDKMWESLKVSLDKQGETGIAGLRAHQKELIELITAAQNAFIDDNKHPMYDIEVKLTREQRIARAKETALSNTMSMLMNVSGGPEVAAAMARSSSTPVLPHASASTHSLARDGLTSTSKRMHTGQTRSSTSLHASPSDVFLTSSTSLSMGASGVGADGEDREREATSGSPNRWYESHEGMRSSQSLVTAATSYSTAHSVSMTIRAQANDIKSLVVKDSNAFISRAVDVVQLLAQTCLTEFRYGLHLILDVARDHIAWLKRRHEIELRDVRTSISQQVADMLATTRADIRERLRLTHERYEKDMKELESGYLMRISTAASAYKGMVSQVKIAKTYNDSLRDCILAIGVGAGITTSMLVPTSTLTVHLLSGIHDGKDPEHSADAASASLEWLVSGEEEGKSGTRGKRRNSVIGATDTNTTTGATTPTSSSGTTTSNLFSAAAAAVRRSSIVNAFGVPPPATSSPVTSRTTVMKVVSLPEEVDGSRMIATIVSRVQALINVEREYYHMKERAAAMEVKAHTWEANAKDAKFTLAMREGEVRDLTEEKLALSKRLNETESEMARVKEELRHATNQVKEKDALVALLYRERDAAQVTINKANSALDEWKGRAEIAQQEADTAQAAVVALTAQLATAGIADGSSGTGPSPAAIQRRKSMDASANSISGTMARRRSSVELTAAAAAAAAAATAIAARKANLQAACVPVSVQGVDFAPMITVGVAGRSSASGGMVMTGRSGLSASDSFTGSGSGSGSDSESYDEETGVVDSEDSPPPTTARSRGRSRHSSRRSSRRARSMHGSMRIPHSIKLASLADLTTNEDGSADGHVGKIIAELMVNQSELRTGRRRAMSVTTMVEKLTSGNLKPRTGTATPAAVPARTRTARSDTERTEKHEVTSKDTPEVTVKDTRASGEAAHASSGRRTSVSSSTGTGDDSEVKKVKRSRKTAATVSTAPSTTTTASAAAASNQAGSTSSTTSSSAGGPTFTARQPVMGRAKALARGGVGGFSARALAQGRPGGKGSEEMYSDGLPSSLAQAMSAMEATLGDDTAAQLARARSALEFRKQTITDLTHQLKMMESDLKLATAEKENYKTNAADMAAASTASVAGLLHIQAVKDANEKQLKEMRTSVKQLTAERDDLLDRLAQLEAAALHNPAADGFTSSTADASTAAGTTSATVTNSSAATTAKTASGLSVRVPSKGRGAVGDAASDPATANATVTVAASAQQLQAIDTVMTSLLSPTTRGARGTTTTTTSSSSDGTGGGTDEVAKAKALCRQLLAQLTQDTTVTKDTRLPARSTAGVASPKATGSANIRDSLAATLTQLLQLLRHGGGGGGGSGSESPLRSIMSQYALNSGMDVAGSDEVYYEGVPAYLPSPLEEYPSFDIDTGTGTGRRSDMPDEEGESGVGGGRIGPRGRAGVGRSVRGRRASAPSMVGVMPHSRSTSAPAVTQARNSSHTRTHVTSGWQRKNAGGATLVKGQVVSSDGSSSGAVLRTNQGWLLQSSFGPVFIPMNAPAVHVTHPAHSEDGSGTGTSAVSGVTHNIPFGLPVSAEARVYVLPKVTLGLDVPTGSSGSGSGDIREAALRQAEYLFAARARATRRHSLPPAEDGRQVSSPTTAPYNDTGADAGGGGGDRRWWNAFTAIPIAAGEGGGRKGQSGGSSAPRGRRGSAGGFVAVSSPPGVHSLSPQAASDIRSGIRGQPMGLSNRILDAVIRSEGGSGGGMPEELLSSLDSPMGGSDDYNDSTLNEMLQQSVDSVDNAPSGTKKHTAHRLGRIASPLTRAIIASTSSITFPRELTHSGGRHEPVRTLEATRSSSGTLRVATVTPAAGPTGTSAHHGGTLMLRPHTGPMAARRRLPPLPASGSLSTRVDDSRSVSPLLINSRPQLLPRTPELQAVRGSGSGSRGLPGHFSTSTFHAPLTGDALAVMEIPLSVAATTVWPLGYVPMNGALKDPLAGLNQLNRRQQQRSLSPSRDTSIGGASSTARATAGATSSGTATARGTAAGNGGYTPTSHMAGILSVSRSSVLLSRSRTDSRSPSPGEREPPQSTS